MEIREIGITGVKVSVLGLGGAPLGGNFVDLDDNQAAGVVSEAPVSDDLGARARRDGDLRQRLPHLRRQHPSARSPKG